MSREESKLAARALLDSGKLLKAPAPPRATWKELVNELKVGTCEDSWRCTTAVARATLCLCIDGMRTAAATGLTAHGYRCCMQLAWCMQYSVAIHTASC